MSAVKEFFHDTIEQKQREAIADTRDYPILFDTKMVQSILAGNKTQTRRMFKSPLLKVVDPAHKIYYDGNKWVAQLKNGQFLDYPINCPYGEPRDLLWVKETYAPSSDETLYRADYPKGFMTEKINRNLWKPSIHMPKSACRIWLQITDVKAQRLQSISEDDAQAEGCGVGKIFGFSEIGQSSFKEGFIAKWISIYGIESYYENPWIWAINFRVSPSTQNKSFS